MFKSVQEPCNLPLIHVVINTGESVVNVEGKNSVNELSDVRVHCDDDSEAILAHGGMNITFICAKVHFSVFKFIEDPCNAVNKKDRKYHTGVLAVPPHAARMLFLLFLRDHITDFPGIDECWIILGNTTSIILNQGRWSCIKDR